MTFGGAGSDGNGIYDVIVVGAGLAGLSAAVRLAGRGRSVCVLERLPLAGGLCGSWQLDGYEFVRACNEFGGHVANAFSDLGIAVTFRASRSQVHLGGEVLALPPDIKTVLRILRRAPGLVRLLLHARRTASASLAELIDDSHAGAAVSDLVGIIASLAGVPLSSMRLEETKVVIGKHRGFGWSRPVKPVGGPQAMIDGLVRALRDRGGELRLGVEAGAITRDHGGEFHICTNVGELRARQIVSSRPRWDCYPKDADPGLALAQILLAVRPDFAFPRGIQTVYHVPENVRGWMGELFAGRIPADFGFGIASGFLPPQADHYALAGFFAVPRGEREFTSERRSALAAEILSRAEVMLPGLGRALRYHRLVSPAEFERFHGLSSTPVVRLPRARFERPAQLDAATGIFHAGTSLDLLGNVGNTAVFSGLRAADLVDRALGPHA